MVQTLPFGSIEVPSPGFGAMGISFGLGSNLTLEQAEPVLLKAIELGCTFWDTAVGGQRYAYLCPNPLTSITGCLPGGREREAPGRLRQKAQRPRQGLQYVSCTDSQSPTADKLLQSRPNAALTVSETVA